MKRIWLFLLILALAATPCYSATSTIPNLTALTAADPADLLVIEDVTPTSTTKKITVANFLTSPTLVTPVLGAATGTTLGLTTPRPTAGSGTGVTAGDAGSLRTQVYKVTVAYTNFVSNAVTHDLTIATFPAKSIIHRVIADVTQAFVCADTCTTATLSATLGITAGGSDFLESFDIDAAVAVFGDADAEIGSVLDVASANPGGYVDWDGATMIMRATSATGEFATAGETNLNAGSITFYVLYSILP